MPIRIAELWRLAETVVLESLQPDHRATERGASAVSTAASGGRLWVGVSAGAMLHPATRRAAAKGMVAWGVGSGAAMAAKSVTDRRRPAAIGSHGRAPKTSSMPSSHTAGAAAYATAATLTTPALGVLVVPAAATIAWSRVATARHFPTDVLAGAALGIIIGVGVHTVADRLTSKAQLAADPRSATPTADRFVPAAGG